MKIVRTLIVEAVSDRQAVQNKISTSGLAEETSFIDEKRVLAKISGKTLDALKEMEKKIKSIEGVKNCTILKTQYMP